MTRRWLGSRRFRIAGVVAAGVLLLGSAALAWAVTGLSAAPRPTPVFAYYYIWFNTNSWDRAKVDFPLLGRYSSDDTEVMRQHVRWAKQAGIDGFIVSWKNTEALSRRLEKLVRIADAEKFNLSIIYQGLDFERQPIGTDQMKADLDYFVGRFGRYRAFDRLGKPMVILSGTWEYSREEVADVTATRRGRLFILASERNLDGYRRLADLVDGNAYYWSSVNPDTFAGYQEKLDAMGRAVHANRGLWIAPAAPGFDARLIGGTRIVDRQEGATLRRQIDVAMQSSPDAVGLISWNEFSENSHVEPSQSYGTHYLQVLAEVLGAKGLSAGDFDSSSPGTTGGMDGLTVIGGFLGLMVASTGFIVWRRRI